jgi:hypothetical protein
MIEAKTVRIYSEEEANQKQSKIKQEFLSLHNIMSREQQKKFGDFKKAVYIMFKLSTDKRYQNKSRQESVFNINRNFAERNRHLAVKRLRKKKMVTRINNKLTLMTSMFHKMIKKHESIDFHEVELDKATVYKIKDLLYQNQEESNLRKGIQEQTKKLLIEKEELERLEREKRGQVEDKESKKKKFKRKKKRTGRIMGSGVYLPDIRRHQRSLKSLGAYSPGGRNKNQLLSKNEKMKMLNDMVKRDSSKPLVFYRTEMSDTPRVYQREPLIPVQKRDSFIVKNAQNDKMKTKIFKGKSMRKFKNSKFSNFNIMNQKVRYSSQKKMKTKSHRRMASEGNWGMNSISSVKGSMSSIRRREKKSQFKAEKAAYKKMLLTGCPYLKDIKLSNKFLPLKK